MSGYRGDDIFSSRAPGRAFRASDPDLLSPSRSAPAGSGGRRGSAGLRTRISVRRPTRTVCTRDPGAASRFGAPEGLSAAGARAPEENDRSAVCDALTSPLTPSRLCSLLFSYLSARQQDRYCDRDCLIVGLHPPSALLPAQGCSQGHACVVPHSSQALDRAIARLFSCLSRQSCSSASIH